MKYTKKPIEVEAEVWTEVIKDKLGGNYFLDVGYYRTPAMDGQTPCKHCGGLMHGHGWIDTIVCPGDFIITGIKGERYPCKPDIFEATYDK